MMVSSRRLSLWGIVLFLLLLPAACAPAVATEPEAPTDAASLAPLLPYPAPTLPSLSPVEPAATEEPPPTDEPFPTEEPFPTPSPTPVVTPIPTAAPPFIPLPEGATAEPFSLYWRNGDVILSLRSEGQAEPEIFLDPVEEFGLYMTPEEAYFQSWGAVSPDGRAFALVLVEEPKPVAAIPYPTHIYLLDQQSRELRQLVKYGASPSWSSDGAQLAYVSTETGGLRVVDILSGINRELYTPDRASGHNVTNITWSPDNRYLSILDEVQYESTALLVIDVEAGGITRKPVDPLHNWVSSPRWSSADDKIAFLWGAGIRGGGTQLRVVDLDGNQEQLAYGISSAGGVPYWSPDGKWIAYAGTAIYENLPRQIDLWLVDTKDGMPRRLTIDEPASDDDDSVHDSQPMWSPDGSRLVFRRGHELWTMSLIDGSRRKLLVDFPDLNIGLNIGR